MSVSLGEVEPYYDLGTYHRQVDTPSPQAQIWTDRGVTRDILTVAAEMLDGEIAYREGQFDDAFADLRPAIELDDALPYDEPRGWMQPTRHAYGAAATRAGPHRRGGHHRPAAGVGDGTRGCADRRVVCVPP